MGLQGRRRLFVDHYLSGMNGAEAARRAGYAVSNAKNTACLLLQQADVKAAIEERCRQSAMDADEALHHLGQIGRGEWSAAYRVAENGEVSFDLKRAAELGLLPLIEEIRPVPGTSGYRVRFPSRLAALKTILSHLGLLRSPGDAWVSALLEMEERLKEKETAEGAATENGEKAHVPEDTP